VEFFGYLFIKKILKKPWEKCIFLRFFREKKNHQEVHHFFKIKKRTRHSQNIHKVYSSIVPTSHGLLPFAKPQTNITLNLNIGKLITRCSKGQGLYTYSKRVVVINTKKFKSGRDDIMHITP
jgi:hypothetical protein